jgi:hypothetical protein
MIIQLVTASVVYALLTTLIIVRPATGRRLLGLFFVAMGVGVNGALTVLAPQMFVELARQAPWAWYRAVGMALVEPAPRLFGVTMVLVEVVLALLLLGRGRAARAGLIAVAVFLIGITPLGGYTLANPILAAGALRLARLDWPTWAFARPARRPRRRRPSGHAGPRATRT